MKLLDRYILKSLFASFLICIFLIVGFYIIIDLFTNFDKFQEYSNLLKNFTEHSSSLLFIMAEFYFYHTPLIFYMLCPLITLLSAMFTLTKICKSNELLPLKSCGISMYRLMYPFIYFSILAMIGMIIVQEYVIPPLSTKLELLTHVKYGRKKSIEGVQYCDYQGNVFFVGQYFPLEQRIENLRVMIPVHKLSLKTKKIIKAKTALWKEENQEHSVILYDGILIEYDDKGIQKGNPMSIPEKGIEIKTEFSDKHIVYPARQKLDSISTKQLLEILEQNPKLSEAILTLHSRFSMPLSNIILIFLGLPWLLRRQSKNFFIGIGICAIISGAFYGFYICLINLGYKEIMNPIFAAWFPSVFFSSLGASFYKLIHT
ncbi:MAG TPA: LptF/LptG family permease [Planctomycetota bacterium]|nr:LptF/LptG family permease [Planctomycetota bacterium]HRU51968.1 LptF/LptG family permease [Planctomycetota bacterium]